MKDDIYIHITVNNGVGDMHIEISKSVKKSERRLLLLEIVKALKLTPSDLHTVLDDWMFYLHTH